MEQPATNTTNDNIINCNNRVWVTRSYACSQYARCALILRLDSIDTTQRYTIIIIIIIIYKFVNFGYESSVAPVFNQSIKQVKDYELQSIDSLSNKSIAESEARSIILLIC